MKKLVSLGVAAALLAGANSVSAGSIDYQLDLSGVNFIYDPFATYDEIGTGTDAPLFDTNNDGTSDAVDISENQDGSVLTEAGVSMQFITIRDAGRMPFDMGIFNPESGRNDEDGNGKGDAVFGDDTFADPLASIAVSNELDSFTTETLYLEPSFIDFRIVLEQVFDQNNELVGIEEPGANSTNTYQIVEEYSFFDILTEDGDNDNGEFDWGLALDATGSGLVTITEGSELTLKLTLDGEIFDDEDSNNLPFGTVDPDAPIQFSFSLSSISSPTDTGEAGDVDFNNFVFGRGTGEARLSILPEPGMLGMLGLSLAGMGILQRRRKQK